MSDVACSTCRACCRGQVVPVSAAFGDVVESYETRPIPATAQAMLTASPTRALAQRDGGDCVYLDEMMGCSIYDRRPAVCRSFSCVGSIRRAGPAGVLQLIRDRGISVDILLAGLERMPRPERRRVQRALEAVA